MFNRSMLAIFALVAMAASAPAQSVEEFYKGKRITITVGYGPGGGYDVFARLLARHIGRHIPGNPQIVVQNMPGAGSLISVNYLYSVAPKDGTAFGLFARDMPMLAILGHNPNVKFDPRKFTWLGSSSDFSDDAYVMIVRDDAPIKSIAQMMKPGGPELVLGGTAEGATGGDVPRFLEAGLGLQNMKLILGYRDSAAVFLAMERNEVAGRTTDLSAIYSVKPDWLKPGGGYRLLVQYARRDRHPDFPNVPTARELATTAEGRSLIEFTETGLLTMARPYAAPPDVPADRAKALRDAFAATHRDPEFLAESKKARVFVSPVGHDAIVQSIEQMAKASPALLDRVRQIMEAGRKKGGKGSKGGQ
jgi:tripartite-type tricarboxylate transporter receptor subunit TctC